MAKKRHTKNISGTEVEASSGNVYKDIGFKNADIMLAKARIVSEITRMLSERHLTQAAAARLLGLSQPKVSALVKGHFDGYSQERLIGLLNRLGRDVEIVVKPMRRGRAIGRVSVAFA